MPIPIEEVHERAKKIRMILLDCDGVLTDGTVHLTSRKKEVTELTKVFYIQDGQGMRLARSTGLKLGIISGRQSPALAERAEEMRVDYLFQGVKKKADVYDRLRVAEKLTDQQIAYIGDDLPDLAVMSRAGLAIAVPDAVNEIIEIAHYITVKPGGRGAVRESIEMILKSQDQWQPAIRKFRL